MKCIALLAIAVSATSSCSEPDRAQEQVLVQEEETRGEIEVGPGALRSELERLDREAIWRRGVRELAWSPVEPPVRTKERMIQRFLIDTEHWFWIAY